MRLTIILVLAACLQTNAGALAQKVTLDLHQAPLKKAFQEISRQTSLSVFYDEAEMSRARPVTCSLHDAPLNQALASCLSGQDFNYTLESGAILIRLKPTAVFQSADTSRHPVPPPQGDLRGKIVNDKGDPIQGAAVLIKGTTRGTNTNEEGDFILKNVPNDAILAISSVGIYDTSVLVNGSNRLFVRVRLKSGELGQAIVSVSNGYQQIPKERATGSFDYIDNKLINRSVSSNILDRIENLTPGLLFNHGSSVPLGSNSEILIRGQSTINADPRPLIVLDNFPYDGDMSNINPNDVESITILKDAAAASIWGARSGNGVIVITTKKGKSGSPQVNFNSSVEVTQKPDLSNISLISSSDYIDLEKNLYAQGNYQSVIDYNSWGFGYPAITPVVESLIAGDPNSVIDSYKQYDVRKDMSKYLYQTGVNQQYALNVSGATPNVNYYLSAGWDHKTPTLISQTSDRFTLRGVNSFKVSQKIAIESGLNYVQNDTKYGNNPGWNLGPVYPYAQLADAKGNPLNLDNNYRKIYTDTVSSPYSWKYNPIKDIYYTDNSSKTRDFLINMGVKYRMNDHLNAEIKYNYENSLMNNTIDYSDSSFFVRDMVNRFYQPSTNTLPVPMGHIVNTLLNEVVSHQGRAQINYDQTFGSKHKITAIAGWDIKQLLTTNTTNGVYGYQPNGSAVATQLDFTTQFTQYDNQYITSQVSNPTSIGKTLDRFISLYGNAAYNFDRRYSITASARNDAANLFGVKTNQKGVPLWSIGTAWQLSNESFYNVNGLPLLRLRATFGHNGNFSRSATAAETIQITQSPLTSAFAGNIQNPPNALLRWEQVAIMNFAADFETKNKVLSGTIEYYQKKSSDLMAPVPVDPTLGLYRGAANPSVYKNAANMGGHGVEIRLESRNLDAGFKWYTSLFFSYVNMKVTKYLLPESTNGSVYLVGITPIVGKPLYSIYSYKAVRLDTAGNPQGMIGKMLSTDYAQIVNGPLDSSFIYNGPMQPTYFGAMRNTFMYKNLSLSFNISYKFGYYFRKTSVNYTNLTYPFIGGLSTLAGSGDYAKRWMKPGDELKTTVPSLQYPADGNRDQFYTFSQTLVEKADNIRLEDIRLAYSLFQKDWSKLPFKELEFYAYASNLGVIWVANKDHIDPYYPNNNPKNGRSIAGGIRITF